MFTGRPNESAEDVDGSFRTWVVSTNSLTLGHERNDGPLPLAGNSDDTCEQAGLALECGNEIPMADSVDAGRVEVLDDQINQIIDNSGPAAGAL